MYLSLQSPGQIIKVNFVYISSSFIQSDRSAWRKNSLLCSLLINKLIVTQIWVNISKLVSSRNFIEMSVYPAENWKQLFSIYQQCQIPC